MKRIFPSFSWGNIRPRDAIRPITRERKYVMDYKAMYGHVYPFIIYSTKLVNNERINRL